VRKRWTPREDWLLEDCIAGNHPLGNLARSIRRSKRACLLRASKLGLTPSGRKPVTHRRWTAEEIQTMIGMLSSGYDWDEIAARLNRSVLACQSARGRLRATKKATVQLSCRVKAGAAVINREQRKKAVELGWPPLTKQELDLVESLAVDGPASCYDLTGRVSLTVRHCRKLLYNMHKAGMLKIVGSLGGRQVYALDPEYSGAP